VRRQDPIRMVKERELTTRFPNTVGLRGRVRGGPHSNHRLIHQRRIRPDCRCNAAALAAMSRISGPGSAPHFPVTGFRSHGLSLEVTFVLKIGTPERHLQEII